MEFVEARLRESVRKTTQNMRSITQYYQILEKLVVQSSNEKELERNIRGFLEFVAANNDVPLLQKIFRDFEIRYCKKEKIAKVQVELSEDFKEHKVFISKTKEMFENRDKHLIVQTKVNPDLISGVRINYNDSYLIEASFDSILRQLFMK